MLKKQAKRFAAATVALCLSGCAATSQNLHEPRLQPRQTAKPAQEPRQTPKPTQGDRELYFGKATEEPARYLGVGCSPIKNISMAHASSASKARGAIARKLSEKDGLPEHTLVGSKIKRFYANSQGHLCVEIEMPKR